MKSNSHSQIDLTKIKQLPPNLHEALIGILLSDGYLAKPSLNASLEFKQTRSKIPNSEYFDLVHDLFLIYLTPTLDHKRTLETKSNNNKIYLYSRLRTRALPVFNSYHTLFYSINKKKIVPYNIESLLTPIGLAHWIMGDGSGRQGDSGSGSHLHTYGFTENEVLLLRNVLFNKFNLRCSLQKKDNKFLISIWSESMPLLRDLVTPYMTKSMLYKVNLDDKAIEKKTQILLRTSPKTLLIPDRKHFLEVFTNEYGKKHIPNNINNILTLKLLAGLIMDCGVCNKKAIHLKLFNVSIQETQLLLNAINQLVYNCHLSKIEIKGSISENQNHFLIRFTVKDSKIIGDLVYQYMHESMLHRIAR